MTLIASVKPRQQVFAVLQHLKSQKLSHAQNPLVLVLVKKLFLLIVSKHSIISHCLFLKPNQTKPLTTLST